MVTAEHAWFTDVVEYFMKLALMKPCELRLIIIINHYANELMINYGRQGFIQIYIFSYLVDLWVTIYSMLILMTVSNHSNE